jgi:squalene cyclase
MLSTSGDRTVRRQHLPARQSAASFLLLSQNSDGGWGYALGQHSVLEPTAAGTLALSSASNAHESYERALNWIQAAQNRDGGWGCSPDDGESGWQTAWAVLALAHAGVARSTVDRGAAWLLAVETLDSDDDPRMEEVLSIDPDLRGWPWRPGEASFVEPTALAMLALHAGPPTERIRARLDEAVTYLQDRRCRGGGWNVGNPMMFSKPLPPRAHPTAWALLALAQIAPQAIVDSDRAALLADMERDGGALALAWGVLALTVLGKEEALMTTHLATLQTPNGGWNENPYHTAVATMALQGGF